MKNFIAGIQPATSQVFSTINLELLLNKPPARPDPLYQFKSLGVSWYIVLDHPLLHLRDPIPQYWSVWVTISSLRDLVFWGWGFGVLSIGPSGSPSPLCGIEGLGRAVRGSGTLSSRVSSVWGLIWVTCIHNMTRYTFIACNLTV